MSYYQLPLIAQVGRAGPFWGYGLGELAILLVVLCAIIALVYIALRQFGISIPLWVQQVGWILLVAFVVILAIRLVLSM